MVKNADTEELKRGWKIIDQAGLSSAKYIEAHNLWRSLVFLRKKLDHHSLQINEVEPEDITSWV